jgi:choline dehydrogenase-like flavoprotein
LRQTTFVTAAVDEPRGGKEFYEADLSRGFALCYTFRFGRDVGPIAMAVASEAKGLLSRGAGHHAAFRRLNGHRLDLSAICEDLPDEHNRVTLDPVLQGRHGIPAPRIDYRIGENTTRMMEHGITRAKEILAAAEATDICVSSPIPVGTFWA